MCLKSTLSSINSLLTTSIPTAAVNLLLLDPHDLLNKYKHWSVSSATLFTPVGNEKSTHKEAEGESR